MKNSIQISHEFIPPRLTFRVAGFWSAETVVQFRSDMHRNAAPFVQRGLVFDVLADMTDFPPQSQDVSAELQACMMRGVDMGMRRTACLATKPITRLQFKRIAAYEQFRFFEFEPDALAWLDEGLDSLDTTRAAARA